MPEQKLLQCRRQTLSYFHQEPTSGWRYRMRRETDCPSGRMPDLQQSRYRTPTSLRRYRLPGRSELSLFLISLFNFFLRHPMRFDDLPVARIIEFNCEKKIYAEPVGHFAGIVPLRDDLLQTGIEKSGIGIDPPIQLARLPNESQIQSLLLQLLLRYMASL